MAGNNPQAAGCAGCPGRRAFLGGVVPMAWAWIASGTGAGALAGEVQTDWSTEDRIAVALMHFRAGYHCSQSVLAAYAEEFDLDEEFTLRIAAGLAGGSTVGGECGTVASGYLVLGLRHARLEPAFGDISREEELFGRIRRFVEGFRELHGSINCRELLGVDPCQSEGRKRALEAGLFEKRCTGFIRDAITMLDSLG